MLSNLLSSNYRCSNITNCSMNFRIRMDNCKAFFRFAIVVAIVLSDKMMTVFGDTRGIESHPSGFGLPKSLEENRPSANAPIIRPPHDSHGYLDSQSRLLRDLFSHYDRRVRPVKNYNSAVNITLTMTLYQLVQVNEPEEYVVINIWMAHTWKDEFLAWDPEKYDNIQYLVIPWDHVWLSDIVLYNGLDMDLSGSEKRINIELTMSPSDPHRAQVRFAFPAIYRFNCKMDVYYFPFDRQNCTMVFGSWIYDSRLLDVMPHNLSVKFDNFITNQEWEVKSFNAYRHVLKYSCCPHPYTNVQYHFVIQRKPLFFVCNYVVPTVIVAFISFLGFFTPGSTTNDRQEKITLGISTLLAMSILLLMVSDKMPTAGSYIPMMALFFLAIIVLVAFGIALTTIVILIQRCGRYGRKLSPTMRRIFINILAKLLFVDVPPRFANHYSNPQMPMSKDGTPSECQEPLLYQQPSVDRGSMDCVVKSGSKRSRPDPPRKISNLNPNYTSPFSNGAVPARRTSFVIDGALFVEGYNEWETVADVVERILLLIFITLLFSLSAFTLYTAVLNATKTLEE